MINSVREISLAALAAGEPEAWETLRACYAPLCRRWGERAGIEPADLWQEAAIRLWRALASGKLANGGAVGAWLTLCVRHAAADYAKSRGGQTARVSSSYHAHAEVLGAGEDAYRALRVDPPDADDGAFWRLALDILGDDAPVVLGRLLGGVRPRGDRELYRRQRNGMLRLRWRAAALYEAHHGEPMPPELQPYQNGARRQA